MSDKTLAFTAKQLAEALNNVRCLYDLGPELIAAQVFAASAQQPAQAVPAVRALLHSDSVPDDFRNQASGYRSGWNDCLAAAPAAPVAQEPSTFWVLFDATTDEKYIKKMMPDGSLAFFECEADAMRAKARNPGTDYKRVDYYTAPPAAEQPECVTCSGHGLVGNRLDDGEECPECHGAGIIYGTECGACAEQPDTVAVPRELLEELVDIADASECFDPAERGRHLLSGGEA